jgi:hypothetical protein
MSVRSLVVRSCLVLAPLWAVAALSNGGCKKEQPTQYPPTPPQNYAPTQSASSAPPADAGLPPPTDAGPAVTQGDGGPKPLDIITTQSLEAQIKSLAKKKARGMKASGTLVGGIVAEGGQVESQIMIDAHKCYVVVGASSGGVTQLDIQIVAKPMIALPLPSPVIAVSTGSGTETAISPCWKNPTPISFPAAVIVKAKQGAGAIGAQVYVK